MQQQPTLSRYMPAAGLLRTIRPKIWQATSNSADQSADQFLPNERGSHIPLSVDH